MYSCGSRGGRVCVQLLAGPTRAYCNGNRQLLFPLPVKVYGFKLFFRAACVALHFSRPFLVITLKQRVSPFCDYLSQLCDIVNCFLASCSESCRRRLCFWNDVPSEKKVNRDIFLLSLSKTRREDSQGEFNGRL